MGFSVCIPLPGNGQYQTQWDYVLTNFKPDELYVIGDEAEAPTTNVFSKLNATYIKTFDELPQGADVVILAAETGRYIQGETSLIDFDHPANCIYFFGHDTHWVTDSVFGGRNPAHVVYVPTDTADDMWSWVTYGVVAWDRNLKRHGAQARAQTQETQETQETQKAKHG